MDDTALIEAVTVDNKREEKSKRSDFDSPWKGVIDLYFEDFMALCWPEKHTLIDWSKGYKMLEQALLKIDKEAAIKNKNIDKLIELHCKSGDVSYLILHKVSPLGLRRYKRGSRI